MNVSEFAGGYTKAFANAMLDGAEEFLSKKMQPESLVQGGEVAEEQFEDVEDENRQDLLRGEDEEQGGARQDLSRGEGEYEEESQDPSRGEGADKEETQLSKLHRRLGHPSNSGRGFQGDGQESRKPSLPDMPRDCSSGTVSQTEARDTSRNLWP